MTKIILTTRDGVVHQFEGIEGISLMENIRDAGFDELLAMCGGCMSCATCHVYIQDLPQRSELPEISQDEKDLLEGSDHRQNNSRLSCQIPIDTTLDGIHIAIAPED